MTPHCYRLSLIDMTFGNSEFLTCALRFAQGPSNLAPFIY
jgi:hypothetical protein